MDLEISKLKELAKGTDLVKDIEIIRELAQFIKKERKESYDEGYEHGYEDGRREGYDDGYEEGSRDGYDRGYEEGFEQGREEANGDEYEEGMKNGYDKGYSEGFSDGSIKGLENYLKKLREFPEGKLTSEDAELLLNVRHLLLKYGLAEFDLSKIGEQDIVYAFLQLSDYITKNGIYTLIDKDAAMDVADKLLERVKKFLFRVGYANLNSIRDIVLHKNEKILELLKERYALNDTVALNQGDSGAIRTLLENISKFEAFATKQKEYNYIYYSISSAVANYARFLVEQKLYDEEDKIFRYQLDNIIHIPYKDIAKELFLKDSEWLSIKQEFDKTDRHYHLTFLGAGGVNSNLLYTLMTTRIVYSLTYEKYSDAIRQPHPIWICDYDNYDITNLFRILPPVRIGKRKSEELVLSIARSLPRHTGITQFDSGHKYDSPEKLYWLKPINGSVNRTLIRAIANQMPSRSSRKIFIGLVNSTERKDVYEKIYEEGQNLIEVAFQDDKFYITLNPQNLSDSSIIRETYGKTDNVLFMLASYEVAKAVDKLILKILKSSEEVLPTETIVVDAADRNVYGNVLDTYLFRFEEFYM